MAAAGQHDVGSGTRRNWQRAAGWYAGLLGLGQDGGHCRVPGGWHYECVANAGSCDYDFSLRSSKQQTRTRHGHTPHFVDTPQVTYVPHRVPAAPHGVRPGTHVCKRS